MKVLEFKTLAGISGGEYSQAYTCFAYGVAIGLGIVAGGPFGWLGAAVALGDAINQGCG